MDSCRQTCPITRDTIRVLQFEFENGVFQVCRQPKIGTSCCAMTALIDLLIEVVDGAAGQRSPPPARLHASSPGNLAE